jgi:hypothetical protein
MRKIIKNEGLKTKCYRSLMEIHGLSVLKHEKNYTQKKK